ncbi:MAG TPA: hypothetical protein VK602_00695 [Phyllobacterium sp.]|nr:hypothetical protein [Phyllobacterium sp.]
MMQVIPLQHLDNVCKMGHGAETCRYIVADGGGIKCAKHEPVLVEQINRRVAANAFVARGDNCEGLSDG